MKCPTCGHSEVATKVQDKTLLYGGQSLLLHGMKGDFCPKCGEGIWDEESYRRYTEAQSAIIRTAKEDVSADIRRIRKSLKLTQTELSEVAGIGKVAFSRYERGETRPPRPSGNVIETGRTPPGSSGRNKSVQISSQSCSC